MSLINVTRKERNGIASVSDDLITTDKIAVPIREISGEAYISVIESPLTGRGSETLVIGNYLVSESLTTVCDSTASLFKATVLTRGGRTPNAGWSILGFVAEKIMGPIMTEGTGSKFLYHEDNGTYPVEFVVSESPATIIAQTGTGGAASNIYTADGTIESDRTVDGGGSAGLFFQNLKDFQLNSNDKANLIGVNSAKVQASSGSVEIISDYASGNHTIIDGIKIYKALLTQSGTNDPVATVLQNTLGGAIVWTRDSIGEYSGTLAGAFTLNKSLVFITKDEGTAILGGFADGTDTIYISQQDTSGVYSDGFLCSISIEVYP